MKVVIVNTSEAKGGAAIVSRRLTRALAAAGVDARMLVVNRSSSDPLVGVAGTPARLRRAFLAERLQIFLANGLSRRDLFKVSTASCGVDPLSHPWIKEADVVCLNWINQGMMSLSDVARLGAMGKRIVWTMHDMWCATGICHHAYDCARYTASCGRCRFVRFPWGGDLSRAVWKKKKAVFDATPIQFVAVSRWLADRCRRSSLLGGKPIEVIPNAVPTGRFDWRRSPDAPADKKIITMGAARIDDSVKGFDLLTEALALISDSRPDVAERIELRLFGAIRDESLLSKIRVPFKWLGEVAAESTPGIYSGSDIVVSASHFETLGMTLAEGMSAGCLAVAFDHGGQSDVIDHLRNGYLATYPSVASLADGIVWAVGHNADRRELHAAAERRFSERSVADAYISLFNRI